MEMLKYYKCYKAFLSGILMKLVVYLFYPLMMILFCGLMGIGMGVEHIHAMYALLTASGGIIWIEMLLDIYIYGGILAKDTNKLEYLKTSCKGMSVLKKGLYVDKLRRLMTMTLILGVIYAVCHEQVSVGQLISLILVTAGIEELGLLIIRHFSSLNWVLIVAMVANVLGVIVGVLAVNIAPIFAVLFLLMFAGIFVASNKVTMKKAEGSFYDAGVEKVL